MGRVKSELAWKKIEREKAALAGMFREAQVEAGAAAICRLQLPCTSLMTWDDFRTLAEAVLDAQAIETRRAETERLGAQHESAVPQGCAQTPPESPHHDQ